MKPKPIDMKTEAMRAALIALYEANDGFVPPNAIVEYARDPSSPLHDEFEWDDGEAAEAYRLLQAGGLIRRLRVTIIRQDPKTKKVAATLTRQFQSRPSQRRSDRGYETVQDIMADEAKRAELLATVLREIRSYRKRYAELVELESVWSAIDEASSDLLSDSRFDDRPSAPAA